MTITKYNSNTRNSLIDTLDFKDSYIKYVPASPLANRLKSLGQSHDLTKLRLDQIKTSFDQKITYEDLSE